MTRKPVRQVFFRALSLAVIAASIFLTEGCGFFNASRRFNQELKAVDGLSSAGKRDAALKRLRSLRKSASAASQWLSLAKRELSLSDYEGAEDTLELALFKMPANDQILAVLVDTLAREGKTEEALLRSDGLRGTQYRLQGAVLELTEGETRGTSARNPAAWEVAAESLDDPSLWKNAALWHAASGNLPLACVAAEKAFRNADLSGLSLRDRLLPAFIYYDAGFPETALGFIDPNAEDPLTLSLLADLALERRSEAEAAGYWASLAEEHPNFSPVPWFNLSLASPSADMSMLYLDSLLDRFPSYFPGIARYVRLFLEGDRIVVKDSLTLALEAKGFFSLAMRAAARSHIATEESAAARISAAEAASGPDPDIRLWIEGLRLETHRLTNSTAQAARVWELLERRPDSDIVYRWGMYFFLTHGLYDAAFSLNRDRPLPPDPFYDALEAAMDGDLASATESFNACANSSADSWAAMANLAVIAERQGRTADAVDYFDRATSFAPNDDSASVLQYRSAVILAKERDTRRAEQVLMRALVLNPENGRASALLRRIQGL